jgi:hypothetical protein
LFFNSAQCIGGSEDGDVLKVPEIEQIKITYDDEIGAGSDGASEHKIVIGVAADRCRERLRFYNDGKAPVILDEIGGRRSRQLYTLSELIAGDDFGQLGQPG